MVGSQNYATNVNRYFKVIQKIDGQKSQSSKICYNNQYRMLTWS